MKGKFIRFVGKILMLPKSEVRYWVSRFRKPLEKTLGYIELEE